MEVSATVTAARARGGPGHTLLSGLDLSVLSSGGLAQSALPTHILASSLRGLQIRRCSVTGVWAQGARSAVVSQVFLNLVKKRRQNAVAIWVLRDGEYFLSDQTRSFPVLWRLRCSCCRYLAIECFEGVDCAFSIASVLRTTLSLGVPRRLCCAALGSQFFRSFVTTAKRGATRWLGGSVGFVRTVAA